MKHTKFVISSIRQKGSPKKPWSQIYAAASHAPATKSNELNNPHSKDELDNLNKVKETKITAERGVGANFPPAKLNVENIAKSSDNKHLLVNLKVLYKPDITTGTLNFEAKKDEEKKENLKAVKLLNVVKLSDLEWHKQDFNIKHLLNHYKSLAKYRLTGLVVLTTLAGYGMAPGTFEPSVLCYALVGTGLLSAAANAINQILEVPYDSQMNRTKNRVLIRGLLTPLHASGFAVCCASAGLLTLYSGTHTLTCILGAANLILYTSVYTPLKRCSIINTWVGSIVGSIPPLIGWSACTGTLSWSALLMGAILYSWQFPHFNALSWNLRPDYSKAGYRMTSVIDPALCRRTALRHSVAILALCSLAPVLDLTTWTFAFDSLPLNAYLVYCSWQFYKKGDSQTSRKLFRLSLIHLPTLIFLMLIGKKYVHKETIV